ncbi:MAG: hypothetical protein HUJ97_07810, partial [Bacteroidales bacterium]|nr:hypothetical protein [Bacteroidales bacterium]
ILGLAEKYGWDKEDLTKIPKDLTVPMAIIPVDVTTNSNYNTVLSVMNYIIPTSSRIKKGKGKQSVQILYSIGG